MGSSRASDFLPILRPFKASTETKFAKDLELLANWITNEFDRKMETTKIDENFQCESFLDFAITQYIKKPTPQHKTEWVFAMIDLLVAAVGTSSTTVIWNLVGLALHLEVAAKVRQEMDRVLPNRRPATYDDMKEMHYTRAAINECQRIFPIALVALPRVVTAADGEVKIKGYDIPQGTTIFLNYWEVIRNAKEWADPDRFIPERFLTEEQTFTDNGLNVFGMGPRNCVGQNMAEIEIFQVTVNLIQNFTFELPVGWTYQSESSHTLRPKGNTLKMKISHRVDRA